MNPTAIQGEFLPRKIKEKNTFQVSFFLFITVVFAYFFIVGAIARIGSVSGWLAHVWTTSYVLGTIATCLVSARYWFNSKQKALSASYAVPILLAIATNSTFGFLTEYTAIGSINNKMVRTTVLTTTYHPKAPKGFVLIKGPLSGTLVNNSWRILWVVPLAQEFLHTTATQPINFESILKQYAEQELHNAISPQQIRGAICMLFMEQGKIPCPNISISVNSSTPN